MALTLEELTVIRALAEPIAFGQRAAFIAAVVEAMARAGGRGPGAAHRIAGALQTTFVRQATPVTPKQARGGGSEPGRKARPDARRSQLRQRGHEALN